MKKIIHGLFGLVFVLAVALMPLQGICSEGIDRQPTAEELAAFNEEMANLSPEQLEQMFNEYLATLSPEEREKVMEEYTREIAALEQQAEGDTVAEQANAVADELQESAE